MALELPSLLCTFENSTKRNEISFDPDFFRIAKRSIVDFAKYIYHRLGT